MGALQLHAIAVEEVRAVVGADESLAARLRAVAEDAFRPAPAVEQRGLLSKLGPIFRRAPGALVVDPADPTPADLDTLLAGRYVPPDRQLATWTLLQRLVAELAWGSLELPLGRAERDAVDFDLARSGTSSEVGLGRLCSHDAMLGVLPPPGQSACARPHAFALEMAAAWDTAVLGDGDALRGSPHRDDVVTLAHWLNGFEQWGRVAEQQGRPAPGVVVFASR
ncbi:DUF7691 family protein [Desertihabitans aurantiacus]|uniref:DUF7691 family protein n=1 Tax=Desertihabitans aurantiacus TaxID=2282477 RepID=UPI000DF795C0|nr:hypothetical protein [Desertihabitans aurantiacus]